MSNRPDCSSHAAKIVADVVLRERLLLAVLRVQVFGGAWIKAVVDLNVDVCGSSAPVVDGDLLADRAAAVVLVIGVFVEVDEVVAGVVFDDALPRRLQMEARVFGMAGQTAAHVADDRDLAHVHGVQACGDQQHQSDEARNEADAGPLDVVGQRDAGDGGAEEQQDDGDDEPDHEGSFQRIRPFPRAGRLEVPTKNPHDAGKGRIFNADTTRGA